MPRRCLVTAATEQMYPGQEPSTLAQHRRRLLQRAYGRVLDLSSRWVGNQECYVPGQVETLSVLAGPRPLIRSRLGSGYPLTGAERLEPQLIEPSFVEPGILRGDIDTVQAEAATYDTVVATMALCTVAHLDERLAAVRGWLRPSGQVLILEHVRGTGFVGLAQRVVSPFEEALTGGCRIDQQLTVALRRNGLDLTDCARFTTRVGAGVNTPCLAGVARPHPSAAAAPLPATASARSGDAAPGAP